MKNGLLSLILFILFHNATHAQKNIITILKETYQKGFVIKSKDSVIYQKRFFNAFPSDFNSFTSIYNWDDVSDKTNPLYDVAFNHVNHFFALQCINQDTLIRKIVHISLYAHYEADAVNYFHHNLEALIASCPKAFINVLREFNNKQIISVWAFYFDYENSYDRKKAYMQKLKIISPIDKNMTALITAGYEKSSRYWKNNN